MSRTNGGPRCLVLTSLQMYYDIAGTAVMCRIYTDDGGAEDH